MKSGWEDQNRLGTDPGPSGALFRERGVPVLVFLAAAVSDDDEEKSLIQMLCAEYGKAGGVAPDPAVVAVSRPLELAGGFPRERPVLKTLALEREDAVAFICAAEGAELDQWHAQTIIRSAREVYRCRASALRDPLTGIGNRRYAEAALAHGVAVAHRYAQPLAVAMLDIDDFKRCNTGGHVCGDRVLREFAQLLSDGIRASDLLARYGGDEFLLILPQTDADGAQVMIERLKARIAGNDFGEGRQLSFSAGIACLGIDGDSSEQILVAADRRLLVK